MKFTAYQNQHDKLGKFLPGGNFNMNISNLYHPKIIPINIKGFFYKPMKI